MRTMLGSTLGLLVSGVVAIIDLFLMFAIVRVFNPFAESPCSAATFWRHEAEKCRSVSRKWKGAVLHHLCFPLQGVWAKLAATVTYKCLASLLSNKWNSSYPVVMGWLRCSLGFSLLRSSLMCLHGSRSSSGSPGVPSSVDLAVAEGYLATNDV